MVRRLPRFAFEGVLSRWGHALVSDTLGTATKTSSCNRSGSKAFSGLARLPGRKLQLEFRFNAARRWQSTRSVPEGIEDPTGIFQFELSNEKFIGKAPDIRKQLDFEVSLSVRAALAHYRPPRELTYSQEELAEVAYAGIPDTTTPQQAHDLVVNNVVALALAAQPRELLQIAKLSRFLAPMPVALSAEDTPPLDKEKVAQTVHEENLLTPPGVMNTLATITTMPAGPGFTAFMELLMQRSQEATYSHWLSLVGCREALDTGDVIDFDAPPRARREHDRDAAQRQLMSDMHAALRAHSHLIPYMDEPSLQEALMPEAMMSPADWDAERPLSHAEKVAMRGAQQRWCDEQMPKFAAAFEKLPEDDQELLYALRNGRRSWKLDLPDWSALARALSNPSGHVSAGGFEKRSSAKQSDDAAAMSQAVRRVVMGVLLRGQFLAERPKSRRNPLAMRAVAEAAQNLPEGDLKLLLDKWRTLRGPIAQRAVLRVLRYGRLNPDMSGRVQTDPEVVKAARLFVRAMLSQVLLEAMPVSWVAWSGKLAEAIQNLPEDRLEVLADALALPHAMTEATLTHAILTLVAPERMQPEQLFGYLVEVAKIWEDLGVTVTPEEVHLIRHLTPRIVERLSNMHGSPEEDGVGRLVNEEFLIEVASSLGTMDTSSLMQLKEALHTMTSQEVHDAINMAFDGILNLMGTTKEDFREAIKMISGEEGEDSVNQSQDALDEQSRTESFMATRMAHLDSFSPTCWMPPEIMPMEQTKTGQWTRAFHNTAYALAGILHDDSLRVRADDWAKARLIYLLAEEVGLISEETSNTPASVKYLLSLIPFRADDARIGGPDAAHIYADPPPDPNEPPIPHVDPAQFGIYPVTLGLVNTALEELGTSMICARPDENGETVEEELHTLASLDGLSANAAVKLLIMAEAQRVARTGGLLSPVMGTLLWGWENVPRNFGLTFSQYWGDPFSNETAALETAYACARLARKDEGIRIACSILDFPQKLELAHVVAARRLQESGALGDPEEQYVPMADRREMITREVMRGIVTADGDAETAAVESRSSLGRYLDVLPTAEDAIDYFMSTSNAFNDEVASGGDLVQMRMRRQLGNEEDPESARIDRTGAISSKLAIAGDALLLPDLIQNIADRPVDEVMDFFESLQSLPPQPDVESLREVFKWYNDGFLDGMPYETDPLGAWRKFEEMYIAGSDIVRVRQRDPHNPSSTDPIVTDVFLQPRQPDLREMLAEVPIEEQERGVGNPMPRTAGAAAQAGAADDALRASAAAAAAAAAAAGGGAAAALAAAPLAPLRAVQVDAKGRAIARGRRKASSARVWLSHGHGDVIVNKQPMGAYFYNAAQRAAVVAPLTALGRPGQWTVHATVEGGGRTGQAEALQLGIARAMVKLDPESHRPLKTLGLLTRDPRVVEPKKPAQKKARKKRQWVKR